MRVSELSFTTFTNVQSASVSYPVHTKSNGIDVTVNNIKRFGPDIANAMKGFIEATPNEEVKMEVHFEASWPGNGATIDAEVNGESVGSLHGRVQNIMDAFGNRSQVAVWSNTITFNAPSQKGDHAVTIGNKTIGFIRVK